MRRKELEKRLRNLDWELSRHGRKHDIWTDGVSEIAIPRHKEINSYTAMKILREAEGGK